MNQEIKDRIEKVKNGEIPEGYKKTKAGLIPNHWNQSKAKILFKNYTNKTHNGDLEVLSATQDRGVIPRNELGIDIKFDKNSLKNYKKVDKGDFVISLRSFQGGIEYSHYEGLVSPAYTVLKENKEINKGFYKHYFKTEMFISKLNSVIYGIRDGKQISYGDFSELYLQEPPLPEQQKIATILSTWDKAIELKKQFIEEKKKQKKGLMQKLLTGEVRLPGFDGEWKEVRLGDVSEIVTGTTPSTKIEEYFNGEYPWITPTDINENKNINKSERTLTKLGLSKGRFIPKGSILVTCIASIGKNAILTTDGSCNQQINAILPSDNYSNDFLYYLISNNTRLIESYAGNGGMKILNRETFSNIIFTIPQLKEQLSIAVILNTIDNELELLNAELEALKLQKKGLMQLLLTGIITTNISK